MPPPEPVLFPSESARLFMIVLLATFIAGIILLNATTVPDGGISADGAVYDIERPREAIGKATAVGGGGVATDGAVNDVESAGIGIDYTASTRSRNVPADAAIYDVNHACAGIEDSGSAGILTTSDSQPAKGNVRIARDIEHTTGVVPAHRDALAAVVVDGDVLGHCERSSRQRNCVWSSAREVERDRVAGAYVRECLTQRVGAAICRTRDYRVGRAGIDDLGHDVALR